MILTLGEWTNEVDPCGVCPFADICEGGPCYAIKEMYLEYVMDHVKNLHANNTKNSP